MDELSIKLQEIRQRLVQVGATPQEADKILEKFTPKEPEPVVFKKAEVKSKPKHVSKGRKH